MAAFCFFIKVYTAVKKSRRTLRGQTYLFKSALSITG